MKHIPIIDREHPGLDGAQQIYRFDNGFGASVIRSQYSYGGDEGLFELAVIKFNGDRWAIIYTTPITSGVEGHLTPEAVEELLDRIQALPDPAKET